MHFRLVEDLLLCFLCEAKGMTVRTQSVCLMKQEKCWKLDKKCDPAETCQFWIVLFLRIGFSASGLP